VDLDKKNLCDYKQAGKREKYMNKGNKTQFFVKWISPATEWVMMIMDGASGDDGQAGCGGLIRGADKKWLGGISKFI
jgi:hypothetical protein